MIGVAIGVVFSVVIFTLFPKDNRAVTEYKQKRKQQQTKKQQQQKKQKQALQKMQNDPQQIKKREQTEKAFRQRLFQGMNQKDKKLLQEYLDEKKKQGKTQAQIIKDATNKAGTFMVLSMLLIVLLVFALVLIASQGDFSKLEGQLKKFVSTLYPKFGESIPQAVSSRIPLETLNPSNQF